MGSYRKLPFGYKMECGTVVADSGESSWVRYLFEQYNQGACVRELAERMQKIGVPYVEGRAWNINMVARILADERYTGGEGYPVVIDREIFSRAAEKRQKKAPTVQKTPAQKMLRRKCGCRVTHHIEHEVLYLMNTLANNPERIETPQIQMKHDPQVEKLQVELETIMNDFPADEKRVVEILQQIAAAMYEEIDPREYETARMRTVFQKEKPRAELDADLIASNISAVLVDGNGKVRIKLKNEQIVERGETGE